MIAKFVSDIHIQNAEDSRLKIFESFLRACLSDKTTHLFLLGDIFDLWVGGDHFFQERYSGAVSLVKELRARGVEVFYFEGNHDLHLQKFWQEELGVQVFDRPSFFDLKGLRVRVEHGDQMNPHDTGYLLLRRFLRTAFVVRLVETLPGSWIQAIGDRMSRSSRTWTTSSFKARDDEKIKAMIRKHAALVFQEKPFDVLVSGHVHVRDDFEWSESEAAARVRSVNLGWWSPGASPQCFVLDGSGGHWETIRI